MRSILFVDDEPRVLQGIQRMLRPMRHEWDMTFVASGQQALEAMAQSSFDVVVSDMHMPGMDGAQLLAEVRKRHPDTVRIILSGYTDQEAVLRSVRPAHQYLSKPCEAETLKAAVARAFALRNFLTDPALTRLISGMESLPSLPSMYLEIMAELQSPDVSTQKVGQIISKDVGMSAKILQIVNSAFFGLPRRVADPGQAVTLLGLDTVKGLALSLQIFEGFDRRKLPGFPIDELWEHSMTVAASARKIARRESGDEKVSDDAFLAGLLHDVGKLALAENLPMRYARVLTLCEKKGTPHWQGESEVFGATHAEVGAYLLALWGLPDPIVEAVAYHHCPDECPNKAFSPLSAVHAANARRSASDAQLTGIQAKGSEGETATSEEAGAPSRLDSKPSSAGGSEDQLAGMSKTPSTDTPRRDKAMTERVLFVDDDPNILTGYQRALRKRFSLDTALGAEDGIEKFSRFGPYAVVVSDMRMPGMDGIQFLAKIRDANSDTVRIMLTGHAELSVAMEAINRGNIFRFLMKPCQPNDLAKALEAGIEQHRLVTAERELLDKTLTATIQALVDVLAMVDSEGFGKTLALRSSVRSLAKMVKIQDSWSLEVAAMLLHIGRITLPAEILLKTQGNEPLSAAEQNLIKKAPRIGYDLVRNIPRLEPVARAVLYQAKNYDGSGFPEDSVAGQNIPLGSRVLRILEDLNDLRSTAGSTREALEVMSARSGCYDPKIFERVQSCLEDAESSSAAAELEGARPTSLVFLKELAVGQVLAGDVETEGGKLLISAGHQITEAILAKICNYADFVGVVEPIKILKATSPNP